MDGKIKIEIPKTEKGMNTVFEVEDLLRELGVKFDTGMYLGDKEAYIREWFIDGECNKRISIEEDKGR